MNLCEPRFDDKIALSWEEPEWGCQQAKGDTAESREVGLTGNSKILERLWNSLASLDLENHNFVQGTTEELSFAAL